MAKQRFRYIQDRDGATVYRREVPKDVQKIIGRTAWTRTFKPGMPDATVSTIAASLSMKHDRLIAQARGQELSPADIAEQEAQAQAVLTWPKAERYKLMEFHETEAGDGEGMFPWRAALLNAIEHGGKYQGAALPLSAVYKRDLEVHGLKDGEPARVEEPYETAVNLFIAEYGDLDIREITFRQVEDWKTSILKLWKPATVKRRIGALRAILNRAYATHEIDRKNPFARHGIKGAGGKATDRLPFNRSMLKLIDDRLANNHRLDHETVNIMRLMKTTGAMPSELGGLVIADVALDEAVPYLWIRPNAIRKTLKVDDTEDTDSPRERCIPLIGEGLEAARDAVKRAKVRSKGKRVEASTLKLFESYKEEKREKGANAISATVIKCIRAAGVPKSDRLVGYSFRHTLKAAMRQAGIPDFRQDRIMGHAAKDISGKYGAPYEKLEELADALTATMPFLGDVSDKNYRPNELVKE